MGFLVYWYLPSAHPAGTYRPLILVVPTVRSS